MELTALVIEFDAKAAAGDLAADAVLDCIQRLARLIDIASRKAEASEAIAVRTGRKSKVNPADPVEHGKQPDGALADSALTTTEE